MSTQISNFGTFVSQLRTHIGGAPAARYAGIFTGSENFKTVLQSDYKMTAEEAGTVVATASGVIHFLQKSNMLVAANENFDLTSRTPELRSFNMTNISMNDVEDLVKQAGVHERFRPQAMMAVGQILARASAHSDGGSYRTSFFSNDRVSLHNEAGDPTRNTMSLFSGVTAASIADYNVMPSNEAFGADIDKVIPDIRLAMTVSLLKFHNNILDRIMHRRATAQPTVQYTIPYTEVHLLESSRAEKASERWGGKNRKMMVDLYDDPSAVDTTLTRVQLLKTNDTEGVLLADDLIKVGTTGNVFDLSTNASRYGYGVVDHTDVLSDGAVIDAVTFELSDGGAPATTETFRIKTSQRQLARLMRTMNAKDSADRETTLRFSQRLSSSQKTSSDAVSSLLGICDENSVLVADIVLTVTLNLKTGFYTANGMATLRAHSANGMPVKQEVADAAAPTGYNVGLVAFELDSKYSEENLRKSSTMARMHTKPMAFDIPVGKNYMLDYSFQQALPEHVMGAITQMINIGQDNRGYKLIIDALENVFDMNKLEDGDSGFYKDPTDAQGHEYVASTIVRPRVYQGTINFADASFQELQLRSADFPGNIRQYMETRLIRIVTELLSKSFYNQQIPAGEAVVFKVITDQVILDNALSAPHIHNHLQGSETRSGILEYTRVLPNGVRLEVVATTYKQMRGKIVMIPYREGDPESILNFGHNWDMGAFLAHYTPSIDGAAYKRVFTCAREQVIPTNVVGAVIDVAGIEAAINIAAPLP